MKTIHRVDWEAVARYIALKYLEYGWWGHEGPGEKDVDKLLKDVIKTLKAGDDSVKKA